MADPRDFLKYDFGLVANVLKVDRNWGATPPPASKPYSPDATRHRLASPRDCRGIQSVNLQTAIRNRRTQRSFSNQPLTLDELSFLLWASQGVQAQLNEHSVFKTVPSAGARHALETYLCVFGVTGLPTGLYRYLPLEHELLEEYLDPRLADKLAHAVRGQLFACQAAVTFVWTAVPYRMEFRYGVAAHKFIAIEAGHTCQNLYLACEAVAAGTCAVAVYHQEHLDRLLRVDGKDEFAVYLAPVGKTGR